MSDSNTSTKVSAGKELQAIELRDFCDGCDHGVVGGKVCSICGGTGYATGYQDDRGTYADWDEELAVIPHDIWKTVVSKTAAAELPRPEPTVCPMCAKPVIETRPKQTNCQNEPSFPLHDTVVAALRSPDEVVHLACNDCAIEQPHLISECGKFSAPALEPEEWMRQIEERLSTCGKGEWKFEHFDAPIGDNGDYSHCDRVVRVSDHHQICDVWDDAEVETCANMELLAHAREDIAELLRAYRQSLAAQSGEVKEK